MFPALAVQTPCSSCSRGAEQHGVASASKLERADRLQVLQLQIDLAGRVLEVQLDQRNAQRGVLDALTRGTDLLQRDQLGVSGHRCKPFNVPLGYSRTGRLMSRPNNYMAISTSASISTGMPNGSSAIPTAERACCPDSGPRAQ